MKKLLFVVVATTLLLVAGFTTSALAWNRIVAFGDSLSDDGGADGYGIKRFSNGPVWVEYLAEKLGSSLDDRAWGGALTGGGAVTGGENAVPSLIDQVEGYINEAPQITDQTLITVWAGGNDLRTITSQATAIPVIQNAVMNIAEALSSLIKAGARNILVVNMPNLGATPEMNQDEALSAQGKTISGTFNSLLIAALGKLPETEVNLFQLDVYSLMNQWIEDQRFDNWTDQLSQAGETSQKYLFWDGLHPTTLAHSLLADQVVDFLQTSDESAPDCVTVRGDLSIEIACAAYGNDHFGFTLNAVASDATQLGWLWALDTASLASIPSPAGGCLTLSEDLSLTVPCADFNGSKFQFKLIPFVSTQNPQELFWKIDPESFSQLVK